MAYSLSFAESFFWGDGDVSTESMRPSDRPTCVYQALLSLPTEQWAALARDEFGTELADFPFERRNASFQRRPIAVFGHVVQHRRATGWVKFALSTEAPRSGSAPHTRRASPVRHSGRRKCRRMLVIPTPS